MSSIVFPGIGDADPRMVADQARRLADDLDRMVAGIQPTAADLNDAPVIDWWMLARRECHALMGIVARHPHIRDRRTALTSELVAIDTANGWARTQSRFYVLARPAPFAQGGVQ